MSRLNEKLEKNPSADMRYANICDVEGDLT